MAIVRWNGIVVDLQVKKQVQRALLKAGYVVEAAAKQRCPVDTGNLKASITTELDDQEPVVRVGTNVEYAVHVEMGTTRRPPKPFLRTGLEASKQKIQQIMGGA